MTSTVFMPSFCQKDLPGHFLIICIGFHSIGEEIGTQRAETIYHGQKGMEPGFEPAGLPPARRTFLCPSQSRISLWILNALRGLIHELAEEGQLLSDLSLCVFDGSQRVQPRPGEIHPDSAPADLVPGDPCWRSSQIHFSVYFWSLIDILHG